MSTAITQSGGVAKRHVAFEGYVYVPGPFVVTDPVQMFPQPRPGTSRQDDDAQAAAEALLESRDDDISYEDFRKELGL